MALLWLVVGVRHVDGNAEFGVLHGPLLPDGARPVSAGWTLAPPGLWRIVAVPIRFLIARD